MKVIHVPIYLTEKDGLLNQPYEAVVRAMDLTCFPSFYEPWGYTPQESLALGVPTVTTDYAGFGRWAQAASRRRSFDAFGHGTQSVAPDPYRGGGDPARSPRKRANSGRIQRLFGGEATLQLGRRPL